MFANFWQVLLGMQTENSGCTCPKTETEMTFLLISYFKLFVKVWLYTY